MTKSKMANGYSPEVRARAVRTVFEHRGSYATQAGAIAAIAPKIGCIPQTLSGWVKQAEKDSGLRDGVTTKERDRIKTLERENRELRQANEILRKASAYFAPPLSDVNIACQAAGGQYLSFRYTERLAEAGIEPSVGSVGDSYDNALAETIIGLYKTELVHRQGPLHIPTDPDNHSNDIRTVIPGYPDKLTRRR